MLSLSDWNKPIELTRTEVVAYHSVMVDIAQNDGTL